MDHDQLASATVDALRFEELLAMVRSARRVGDAGEAHGLRRALLLRSDPLPTQTARNDSPAGRRVRTGHGEPADTGEDQQT